MGRRIGWIFEARQPVTSQRGGLERELLNDGKSYEEFCGRRHLWLGWVARPATPDVTVLSQVLGPKATRGHDEPPPGASLMIPIGPVLEIPSTRGLGRLEREKRRRVP